MGRRAKEAMSYKIEITPEAETEIAKTKSWYEEQQVGLGESFTETIKAHINSLKRDNPEHKPAFDEQIGRAHV